MILFYFWVRGCYRGCRKEEEVEFRLEDKGLALGSWFFFFGFGSGEEIS